jgi:hypothetical protein
MTKKEVYHLALTISQTNCRSVFESEAAFKDEYFQKYPKGKKIVKQVYDILEPLLLTPENEQIGETNN